MDDNKQMKHSNKLNDDGNGNHRTIKTTPILILPHPQYSKADSDGGSYQCSSSGSINCATKLSVHYIVSLNNETSLFSGNKSLENDTSNHFHKIEATDGGERKCMISLPLENVTSSCVTSPECDGNTLKPCQSITNQRLLISPTDFLTLSEEGVCQKNPEVRRDVNLSAGSLEILRRNTIENSFAICLDRYCESPLMLEAHKDSHLICDDETSCTGRNSRLSETPEDINADDLFAATFGTDQHPSLREVVTPIEAESTRTTPVSINKESHKIKMEEMTLCDSNNRSIDSDTKPILTVLDPLDANCTPQPDSSTFAIITSSQSSSTSVSSTSSTQQGVSLTAVDIKVLQNGMLPKDSLLLANLAAALPSSFTSKQIAIQVIREDGTSIVLPLTATKSESDSKDITGDLPLSTSMVLAEVVASNEAIRPFKCELCNSTFTRLGNYTRHKKIHSYPSKEDQRFRCEICSKSFIQRCDLARHLHIHRGTEPHRCPQCGKGYIRHSDLVTHQRFHNKEKPFSCPHCSKGFCQRGDLNRHLRSIHLQLKPILCTHCHKKFAKEETLLRHINATHREIVEDTH